MKCAICLTPEKFAFIKHGYTITHCPECGLYRTILKSSYPKMVKQYYTKAYFTGSKHRAGYANYEEDTRIVQANAKKYLGELWKYAKVGSLLDVGCATGTFLDEAKRNGWNGWGIDVSDYAVTNARKKMGARIKQGVLKKTTFGRKKFDAITLLDVFEHIGDPRRLIKTIHSLLRPKGIIIINTGDSASWLATFESSRWHYFIPPQHVYFYSRHNLKKFLESEGFRVVNIHHHGKWLSMRYLLHLMRTINHSRIADIMYRLTNKNFLGKIPLYINMHDNMTVIARKR